MSGDLGFSTRLFNFEEFADSGERIVREHGGLPGLTASLRGQRNRLLLAGKVLYHVGDVSYQGQTQSGAPLQSRTDEAILDLRLRAGYRFDAAPAFGLTPYGQFSHVHWHRDIRGVGGVRGLDEIYSWTSLGIGVEAELHRRERIKVTLDGQLFRILDPQMEADFGPGFAPVTLKLGNEWGGRIRLPVRMPLRNGLSVGVAPWAEIWSLGRSSDQDLIFNGAPVGTLFEPRSESWSLGIDFTIGKTW